MISRRAIFISYRREDSPGYAGRLHDRLSTHFKRDQIFMDIDDIEPGMDFVEAIETAVGSCDVLLAIIGRQWLGVANAHGRRRLDNPEDFVRLEITAALERNIRIIPVLVNGAVMPVSAELPPALAKLARRNAIELTDKRWFHDTERLLKTLEGVLASGAPADSTQQPHARERPPAAPPPAGGTAVATPSTSPGNFSLNAELPVEVSDEERRYHQDARRFARLLVSEIKLYNEKKVSEGRNAGDIYGRLREDIDRFRQMYDKRVHPSVAPRYDYFHHELVNTLAEGDIRKMGREYPGEKLS